MSQSAENGLLAEAMHQAFHATWGGPSEPLDLYALSPIWQAQAEVAVRWTVYEAGMWCGECDPADQDDDCCVLPPRIRAALTRVTPPGGGD